MGSLFGGRVSSSVYDNPQIKNENYAMTGNPNPKNFKILRKLKNNWYTILLIQYPDCTNYEGNKILVFDNIELGNELELDIIDPHFTDKGPSPIARFEPTERGWNMARFFCDNYDD